jgi:hypothetical protein
VVPPGAPPVCQFNRETMHRRHGTLSITPIRNVLVAGAARTGVPARTTPDFRRPTGPQDQPFSGPNAGGGTRRIEAAS